MPKANQGGQQEGGSTPPANDGFTPINSQADLDRLIGERITRERAKFADYDELKAKAAKVDQAEQANQTEAEKTAKRIADLETELSNQRRDSNRLKIAAEFKITNADDIDLFLTGSDDETLRKQAKRLADRDAEQQEQSTKQKNRNNVVPPEGKTSTTPPAGDEPMRELVRQLFDTSEG